MIRLIILLALTGLAMAKQGVKTKICPSCKGKGYHGHSGAGGLSKSNCSTCKGLGVVPK